MLVYVPAVTAILADRDRVRNGNNLRFFTKEYNEQFPDPEYDPGDDLPPPTDEEPIEQALSSLFFHFGDRLDCDVFTFAFWALHFRYSCNLILVVIRPLFRCCGRWERC